MGVFPQNTKALPQQSGEGRPVSDFFGGRPPQQSEPAPQPSLNDLFTQVIGVSERSLGVDQTVLLSDHHIISLKQVQCIWRQDQEEDARHGSLLGHNPPPFTISFKYSTSECPVEVTYRDRATWEQTWEALQTYYAGHAVTIIPECADAHR